MAARNKEMGYTIRNPGNTALCALQREKPEEEL
jgi:hypothetical protein